MSKVSTGCHFPKLLILLSFVLQREPISARFAAPFLDSKCLYTMIATGGHMLQALKKPQNLLRLSQAVLGMMAALAFIAVVHPDVRASVRSTLRADYRTVISTAKGDLNGNGSIYTVAKVKTRDNIYLEIFENIADQAPKLVERIELADTRDAYFNFNGQATNLAIDDVDGDGRPEILAPTFDRNLVGRLNVFQYNDSTRDFQKVVR